MATVSKNRKVWRSSKQSKAGMVVGDTDALLVAHDNLVGVNEFGIYFAGPISMVTDARNLRRGGLFIGLDDFLDMIPSTIITPLPKQIPFPPLQGLTGIAKDVSFFKSLLG